LQAVRIGSAFAGRRTIVLLPVRHMAANVQETRHRDPELRPNR
jgi:hypothetical protein